MTQNNNILILCFSDLARDPRVYRQILFLKDKYSVIAAGWNAPLCDGIQFVRLAQGGGNKNYLLKIYWRLKLLCQQFDDYYWNQKAHQQAYTELVKLDYAIILANDLAALPLAVCLAKEKNAKLIYDAHEYSPREFEDSLKWRLVWQKYNQYWCKKYLKEADVMLTVCDGIAKEYQRHFAVDPVVITNAPFYQDLMPQEVGDKIKIIHHGAAIKSRKLEIMIEMMNFIDNRFELYIMLIGDEKYIEQLKLLAINNKNIHFIPPVGMAEISEYVNQFDIGLIMVQPVNTNYYFGLGNKFFEYIQARLMLAIGPLIEMEKFINIYNVGLIAENFIPRAMAQKLNLLSKANIMAYKNNSNLAARDLSANKNALILENIVQSLLNKN